MLFKVIIDLAPGTKTLYVRASNWEQAVRKSVAALEKERNVYTNSKLLKLVSITYLAEMS